MKKIVFHYLKMVLIPFIALFIGCNTISNSGSTASTGKAAGNRGMTLDQAVKAAASEIEEIIPAKTVLALLNFNSPTERFSEYVLEELTANLVSSRTFTIVDRNETDLIRREFNFQMSGEVSDNSMQELGRMLGAQAIVSGSLTEIGESHRITIRVLSMQTATVEVLYRTDIVNDARVQALLRGSTTGSGTGGTATAPTASGSSSSVGGQAEQQTQQASSSAKIVIVEGSSLAEKFEWVKDNATRNTEYRIEVTADEGIIPQNLSYSGRNNITVRLVGSGGVKTVSHTGGTGAFFTVGSGVTFILDSDIVIRGRNGNNAPAVAVGSGGILIMNTGSRITGNRSSSFGGGVRVGQNGSFTMRGGEITRNSADNGGGVGLDTNASFTMTGGEIFGNSAFIGGGVYITMNATNTNFTMRGGEIYGNSANSGGGVYNYSGNFSMSGGEISGNTAKDDGGGVYINNGSFGMTGGEISGNIAVDGGGVYRYAYYATITKTGGGTIFGFTEGDTKSNRASGSNSHAVGSARSNARNDSGFILRITTAGTRVNLDSKKSGAAGGWEN